MSNSPARNQFLRDCAAADIAPSVAAAELRSGAMTRLSYRETPDCYVAVNWQYNKFLQQFFRTNYAPVYMLEPVCLVFNRKGELIETA